MSSKNKDKRARSATGIANSSFMKNVTSRVTGLLPAGITKWFSSPSSSRANGSAAVADGTDSSTEDEAPESSFIAQPPAKRLRSSSPVNYSQLTTSETTLTSNVITESGSVMYQSIQSSPGRNTFRRETNYNSTPMRAQSEGMGTNINTIIDRSETDTTLHQQNTNSVKGQSISLKRKSLFNNDDQEEQALKDCAKTAANRIKDPKQPHFKPHLLSSPFYSGRTMYGGASSSTYINEPNIKHRKMTYVNESKNAESVNMSTSSRRIMDLLENYSSPLIDARRIPRYELSELTDVNRSLPLPNKSNRNSYKTQELYIPSTASVIRMKARSRLMDSTKAARQIIASHSSTLSFRGNDPIYRDQSADLSAVKSQSKLKTRMTRPNRGEDPFCLPETLNLPTAVLQIDKNNLPNFSFGESLLTTSWNSPSNESFKFSSPLPVTIDRNRTSSPAPAYGFGSPDKAAADTSPPKFSFGNENSDAITKPLSDTESIKSQSIEQSVITFAKAATKSDDWKCPDCWVSNKADKQKCVCCGANQVLKQTTPKASETTAKCTICKLANNYTNSDKCVDCEKMASTPKTTNNPLPVANKTSKKWKCSDCWVENDDCADKCVCCGSRNTKKPNAPLAAVSYKADVVASAAKDWRCDDCLITNKPSLDKCAACGGAKPGTKPAVKSLPKFTSSNFFNKPDNKLAEIVEAQKSYWECRVCLASNANDKTACMCCEAAKEVQDNSAPKFSNFKFDAEPNLSFKFGIDPKVQEKNLIKNVDEELPKKMEESETNNNIISETPNFTFTLPTKKMDHNHDGLKTKEDPKPSFSFGIPKQNSTSTASDLIPFKPVSDTSLDILKPVEDTEKPQEVPSIPLKAPEADKMLPSQKFGLFAAPAPTTNPVNAMNAFLQNNSSEIKTVSSNKKEANVLDTSQPQFSFSAVKPSSGGLFAPPTSTSASSSLTKQDAPTQPPMLGMFAKTDATVPSPAVSFFSKPDNPTLEPSPFQNNNEMNAAPTTPAAAPVAAPAATAAPVVAPPMFSFGSNQSTNSMPAAPVEPKKFNFSFSSSPSTPMFGATPQSNSNAFGLNTNLLSSGSSNPMNGNGISSNPLGGGMSSNPLGGAPRGNGLLGSGSSPMFNAPVKENSSMWPNTSEQTNQVNPFMSTPARPAFSFGESPQSASPFGTPASNIAQAPLVFGTPQPAPNMFGMNQNNASQPSIFSNPAPSQQPSSMFGNSQPSNPTPSMGMFGMPNASSFGTSTPSMSSFEAPAMAPAPVPAFNFGVTQSSTVVFGFGQQPGDAMQGMQAMQPAGGFSFGASPAPGQVQFSMGSAPNAAAGRRVRKAVRRNPQR